MCALRARPLESVFAVKASPSSPTAAWGELSVMLRDCRHNWTLSPEFPIDVLTVAVRKISTTVCEFSRAAADATGKSGTPSPNGNPPADGKLCATLTALARPDLNAVETRQKRGFPPTIWVPAVINLFTRVLALRLHSETESTRVRRNACTSLTGFGRRVLRRPRWLLFGRLQHIGAPHCQRNRNRQVRPQPLTGLQDRPRVRQEDRRNLFRRR